MIDKVVVIGGFLTGFMVMSGLLLLATYVAAHLSVSGLF